MDFDYTWLMSVTSVFVLWGIGLKIWWIWFPGLFSQGLWFYFIYDHGTYGLVPMHLIYTGLYIKNLVRWYSDEFKNKNREKSILDLIKPFSSTLSLKTKIGEKATYLFEDPKKLPNYIKKLIFERFYAVTISAFGQNNSSWLKDEVWKRFFESSGLMLIFKDEKSPNGKIDQEGLAFQAFSYLKEGVIYLEATAIDPNYQGSGICQSLVKSATDKHNYVLLRTQSPVVIMLLQKLFSEVAPITREATEEEKDIALLLAQKLNMGESYDRETLIGRGIYEKSLYDTLPRAFGNNEISKKIYEIINPEKGDCIIAVCKNTEK